MEYLKAFFVGGGLCVIAQLLIDYTKLTPAKILVGYVVLGVVLGGIGSIRGSVIAGALIIMLPEMLRSLQDYRMLIYAIVLIAMMLFTSNDTLKLAVAKYSPVQFVKKQLSSKKAQKEEN